MKKNKKIIITLLFIVCLVFITQGVYAAINPTGSTPLSADFMSMVEKLRTLAEMGVSATLAVFGTLTTLLALILLMFMWSIMYAGGMYDGSVGLPALPDTMIFNRVNILDPNFFTASETLSVSGPIKEVILNMFNTFQVLGISILVITAMIIGIKYALSVIASEKAQFKEALGKWIMGIIILFTIRYFLFGVFLLNEQIVEAASKVAANVEFTVSIFDAIPVYGNMVKNIVQKVTGSVPEWPISGYLGLTVKHIAQGFGGNLFSGIAAFVIMGQTVAILIMYLKRVFYSILLAIIAPLIITMDTVYKSIGKQSKLFANWLKEFIIIVFMQSIHALFLVVVLLILEQTETALNSLIVQGIVAVMLTSGLVRFEKTFKKLFGISDTLMGDLKGGTGKLFGAAHGVSQGVKAVRDNKGKMSQAKSNRTKLERERSVIQERMRTDGLLGSKTPGTVQDTNYNNSQTNNTSQGEQGALESSKVPIKKLSAAELQHSLNNGATKITADNRAQLPSGKVGEDANKPGKETSRPRSDDRVIAKLDELINATKQKSVKGSSGALGAGDDDESAPASTKRRSSDKILKDQFRLAELEEEMAKEEKNYSSARLESMVGAGALAGGLGFGLGATDDFSEALQLGGYVTKGIDSAAGAIGSKGTRKTQKQQYEDSKDQLGKIKKAAKDKHIAGAENMVDDAEGIRPKGRTMWAMQPFAKHWQKGAAGAVELKHMIKGTYSIDSGKKIQAALTKFTKEAKDKSMSSALNAEAKQIVGGLGEVRRAAKDLADGMKSDSQKVKNQSRIREKKERQ